MFSLAAGLAILGQVFHQDGLPEISLLDRIRLFAFHGVGGWLYLGLLIWMLLYCLRNDPDRGIWMWIMLIVQPFGAVAYFLFRWLPSTSFRLPWFLRNLVNSRDLQQKRIAAAQIGNAYQFAELGGALQDRGRTAEALEAFESALKKDPANLASLWGAGSVAFQLGRTQEARKHLEAILAKDPAYKFGDVSLLYANVLLKLGEKDLASQHLEEHVRKWRHPEALFRLAELRIAQGDPDAARTLLQGIIMDIEGSPRAIARKFYFWKGRARRLLKKTPAA